jgi:hypothetical protein
MPGGGVVNRKPVTRFDAGGQHNGVQGKSGARQRSGDVKTGCYERRLLFAPSLWPKSWHRDSQAPARGIKMLIGCRL